MPIRFYCSACGQPIEVDDDDALAAVTCPYCQHEDQAPEAGDPRLVASAPPRAIPAPVGSISRSSPPPPRAANSNLLSWLALICMSLTLACMIISTSLFPALFGSQPGPASSEQTLKMLNEQLSERPASTVTLMVTMMGVVVLPWFAVVFGGIALLKGEEPRWRAVLSLAVASAFLLVTCVGAIGQLAMR